MLEIGLASIAVFFVIIGVCLIFVAAWIIKSESRINICKDEISRLRNQAAAQSGSEGQDRELKEALKNNEFLEAENKKLKRELTEAKKSLEEVYKALSA